MPPVVGVEPALSPLPGPVPAELFMVPLPMWPPLESPPPEGLWLERVPGFADTDDPVPPVVLLVADGACWVERGAFRPSPLSPLPGMLLVGAMTPPAAMPMQVATVALMRIKKICSFHDLLFD